MKRDIVKEVFMVTAKQIRLGDELWKANDLLTEVVSDITEELTSEERAVLKAEWLFKLKQAQTGISMVISTIERGDF